jgi:VanZ family protein
MVIGIGGVDELRQIVLPGRHASWHDFAMDLAGAVSALLLYVLFARMAGNARAHAR